MKANELRLGNWAYVVDKESTPKKTPVQVNLTWLQIADALEPIPLTSEILEKCGLYKQSERTQMGWTVHSNWRFRLIVDHLENPYNNIDVYFDVNIANGVWLGKHPGLKLHQLQNLYYALTGEELEINLSETVKP